MAPQVEQSVAASAAADADTAALDFVATGRKVIVIGAQAGVGNNAFIAGDCTQSAGTASLATFTLDQQNFGSLGAFSLAIGIWSAEVQASGSLTVEIDNTGGSNKITQLAVLEVSGLTSAAAEDSNGGITATDDQTSANSGDATSAGAALFIGGFASLTDGSMTITEGADFAEVIENTFDGAAADQLLHVISRAVTDATTDAADWTMTGVNEGTARAVAVYAAATETVGTGTQIYRHRIPWTRQPPNPTPVDWSNPLTRGLVALFVPWGHGIESAQNRVGPGGADQYDAGMRILNTIHGRAWSPTSQGDRIRLANMTGLGDDPQNNSMTLLYRNQEDFAQEGNPARLFSIGDTDNYPALHIAYDTDGNHFLIRGSDGSSTERSIATQSNNGAGNSVWNIVTGTYADEGGGDYEATLYQNGRFDTDGGIQTPASSYSGNMDRGALFDRYSGGRAGPGQIAIAMFHNRRLSDQEIRELHRNVWQIFQPRELWLPTAAPAAQSKIYRHRIPWTRQPPTEISTFDAGNPLGSSCYYAIVPGWYQARGSGALLGDGFVRSVGKARHKYVADGGTGGSMEMVTENYGHTIGSARAFRVNPNLATSGHYLEAPAGDEEPRPRDPGGFTIVSLIRPNGDGTVATGADPRIWQKGNSWNSADHDLMLGIEELGANAEARFRFRVGTNVETVLSSQNIQADALNLIGGVLYENASGNFQAVAKHLREDGQYQEGNPSTERPTGYNPRNTTRLGLGCNPHVTGSPQYYDGDILIVAMFDAIWGEAEFREFMRNPWQIFEPRTIWLPIAGATGPGGITLTMDDALLSQIVDAPVLTQANTLTMAEANQSIAADAIALTQAHTLALADTLQSVTADNLDITQAASLTVAEALVSVTSGNVDLTQAHTLIVAEALLSLTAENVELSTAVILTMAEALMSVESESVALTQKSILTVAECLQAVAADNIDLTQANTLAVLDALHSVTADAITLVAGDLLAVADALQSVTAEEPALTQANTIVVQESLLVVTADNVSLTEAVQLVVQEALQSSTADAVSLTQSNVLAVAEAVQAVTAANIDLTQASTLVVDDALHALLADLVIITEGALTRNLFFVVEGRNRQFIVARKPKTIVVD